MYKSTKHKSKNINIILECIFRNAPISRTSIATLTGITPATTTLTTTKLLEDHAIFEVGQDDNDSPGAGRKQILLDICPDYRFSIGLEFNQKFFVICITNLKGHIVYQHKENYCKELSEGITQFIIDAIKKLLTETAIPLSKIIGIGIAIPGHIDRNKEFMISNNSVWHNFNASTIRKAFSIPVVVENNARCMALSQYLFHPEYAPDSFAFFHVGLGMFCSNIVDGKLFLGNAYVSGEIGHTIVNPNGLRCECGKQGCLQTIASEKWLIQTARKLYNMDSSSILHHLVTSPDEITIQTLAVAYSMGDEAVCSFISNALRYLGISTSNIAILMNPEKIFLHGELFTYPYIHNELINIINNQLNFVEDDYVDSVEIIPYHPEDGAIGGAALAILECFLQLNYDY